MGIDVIIYIAIMIVALAASLAMSMMMKPKMPNSTQKFEAPTSEIGKTIPVLFGTREISEPRLVWSGDIRIVKVDVDMGGK